MADRFDELLKERRTGIVPPKPEQEQAPVSAFDRILGERAAKGMFRSATFGGPLATELPTGGPPGTSERMSPEQRQTTNEIALAVAASVIFPEAKVIQILSKAGLSGKALTAAVASARAVFSGGGAVAGSEVGQELFIDEDPDPTVRRTEAFARGAAGELLVPGVAGAAKATGRGAVAAGKRIPGLRNIATRAEELGPVGIAKKIPIIRRVVAPFEEKLEPGARESLEIIEELGGTLQPGKPVVSQVIDIPSNIAENALTSSGRMLTGAAETSALTQAAIDNTIDTYGNSVVGSLNTEQRGVLAKELLEGSVNAARKLAVAAYREVNKRTQPVIEKTREIVTKPSKKKFFSQKHPPAVTTAIEGERIVSGGVDLRPIKAAVRRRLVQERKGLGNPEIEFLANKILKKPDVVDFESGHLIRSSLLNAGGRFKPGATQVGSEVQGFAREMSGKVHTQMEKASEQLDPDAFAVYQRASKIWREDVKGTIDDSVFKSMMRSHPDQIMDQVLKTGKPTRIRHMRILAEKERPGSWKTFQEELLERIRFKTTDPISGELNGKKFVTMLRNFGGPDGAALNEVWPNGWNHIMNLGKAHALTQAKVGGNRSGSMLIQFTQANAFVIVAGAATFAPEQTGLAVTGAMILLFTPRAIASLLNAKAPARWLTLGAKSIPGTGPAKRATAQLLSHADKMGIDYDILSLDEYRERFPGAAASLEAGQERNRQQEAASKAAKSPIPLPNPEELPRIKSLPVSR